MMRKWVILIIIWGLGAFLWAQPTPGELFKKYRNSVCLVSYFQNIASNARIGSYNKIEQHRTGILVSTDGLVMVSSDVYPVSLDIVSENGSLLSGLPSDFRVTLDDGREFPADFVGKDDQAQVAFIRIKTGEKGKFPAVVFRSGQHPGIGDRIYVLEKLPKQYDFRALLTPFTVNAVIPSPAKLFLVNQASYALSAGGLVLDADGRAIGVTLNGRPDFAIHPPEEFGGFRKNYLKIEPADRFRGLIENPPQLRQNQTNHKSWLGIRMQALTPALQKQWQVPGKGGVVVNRVYPQSPASRAGLREGDVLLRVDGKPLAIRKDEETARLRDLIRGIPPGKNLRLTVWRGGRILPLEVTLAVAPKSIGTAQKLAVTELGMELRELTRDVLYDDNLPLSTPGVFVYQVDRASPAGMAGLKIGDIVQMVDDRPVRNLADARRAFSKTGTAASKKIKIQVLRNRSAYFVFIDGDR